MKVYLHPFGRRVSNPLRYGVLTFAALLLATCLPSTISVASANDQAGEDDIRVMACDDEHWPPYVFATEGKVMQGFSVDVMATVLADHGKTLHVTPMPWLRCLRELEQESAYQLALGASYTEERASKYVLSRPYHILKTSLFYSEAHWPLGGYFQSARELHESTLCTLRGFPLNNIGLNLHKVDDGHTSIEQLIGKLHHRRCDAIILSVESIEPLLQAAQHFPSMMPITQRVIPWQTGTSFHVLLNSNQQGADSLLALINDGLQRMENDGRLDLLRRKWMLPTLPGPIPIGNQPPEWDGSLAP